MSANNKHLGSSLDDFLHEEGIYDAAKAEAVTRVISWQRFINGEIEPSDWAWRRRENE